MKICGKKLIAGAAALAMTCSMVGVFADEAPAASGNAVTITKVEVLNNGETAATSANTFNNPTSATTGISLTTEQLMRVTAVLKNGTGESATPTAGEISFLSNVNVENIELNNNTIQYVDQQTFNAQDGETVQITFRPRTTIGSGEQKNGTGTFIAKAGGTNVATAASFTYSVTEAKKIMTVNPTSQEVNVGASATFTITPASGDTISAVTVKENNTDVTGATFSNNTLTIPATALTAGTHNFVISADGYNDIGVTVVVKKELSEDEKKEINDALNSTLNNLKPTDNAETKAKEITLPGTAKVGSGTTETNISYTIKDKNSEQVTFKNNIITVPNAVFAAKIVIEADIEGEKVQKTVYVKNTSENIAFGNLELISNDGTTDAFADDTNLTAAKKTSNAKIEASRAEALNYALGRAKPEEAIKSAIDYDLNNEITLSEYRMFKLLLNGDNRFTAKALKDARQGWINPNKPAGN